MTRVQLQPSPFDRLDPVARAIRWWTNQMIDIIGSPRRSQVTAEQIDTGGRKLARHVTVLLSGTDGFVAQTVLPKGQAEVHRRALDLQLKDLAPIPPNQLSVAATAIEQTDGAGSAYLIAMARNERLDQLEAKARRKGAHSVVFQVEHNLVPELTSPSGSRRRRTAMAFDAGLVLTIAILAGVAVSAWTFKITNEAESLAQQERTMRGAAVAVESAHKEAAISRGLVERGILNRRSTSALEDLAALNEATPDNAWWKRIVWTPEETVISAEGADATAALDAISKQAKAWSVELQGTIAAPAVGSAQAFEILAKPRQQAAK